ncbi:MAG: hypothetical protein ACRBF0_23850 [Calditrichia bacterium]
MNTLTKLTTVILLLLLNLQSHAEEKFKLHGHYSQGYAISSGSTIWGIPDDGTFDYRSIGLQFSFHPAEKHSVYFQMRHRRLGRNPLMRATDDVSYDWGFYKYEFSDNSSIQIGKMLRPFGIYSEISDVGVLLPFYQATYPLYFEGNFTSKTYNGVALSHEIEFWDDWNFHVDIFAGEYQFNEWYIFKNPLSGEREELVGEVKVRNSIGLWTWLNTSIEGFRIGVGGNQADFREGIQYVQNGLIGHEKVQIWHSSIDLTRARWFLRSEQSYIYMYTNDFDGFGSTTQLSFEPIEAVRLNCQYEFLNIRNAPVASASGATRSDFDYHRDAAIGISYNKQNKFTLKLETHWNRSLSIEEPISFTEENPPSTFYTIFSISGAF